MSLDISQITDSLYIAAWPKDRHREEIISLDVGLIISMILQFPDSELKNDPLKLIRYYTIDSPITPIPIGILKNGVGEALDMMDSGRSVLVYCKQGVHRSVAMATCILIAQGYTSEEAMNLVKSKRDKAKPDTWYIKKRILKFEKSWNKLISGKN
jgi:protein-tyrosine phosphatase